MPQGNIALPELLPALRSLPREEKIRLVHLLVDELAKEDLAQDCQARGNYPIWTPLNADQAASVLLEALNTPDKE